MEAVAPMELDLATLLGQAFKFRLHPLPLRQIGGIVARRVSTRSADAARWDGFVARTAASFQATRANLRSRAIRRRSALKFFEFYDAADGGHEKLGQCAVMKRGRNFVIQDGLQIAPGHEGKWQQAMASLLGQLGPGRYDYGGLWSCEASREANLLSMRGVTIDTVRPFTVQGVDFGQWESWDRYWKSVSENVRRNARYAAERVPGLRIEYHRGWSMLKTIPAIVRLQQDSLHKKGVSLNGIKQAVQLCVQMVFRRNALEVALAVGDEGVIAFFYGAHLGGKTYYVHGGQRAGGSGAAWFLMREMARQAYERDPRGHFLMGNVDYAIHDEAVGGGLLRARRSMRVTDYETSIIGFRYTG